MMEVWEYKQGACALGLRVFDSDLHLFTHLLTQSTSVEPLSTHFEADSE